MIRTAFAFAIATIVGSAASAKDFGFGPRDLVDRFNRTAVILNIPATLELDQCKRGGRQLCKFRIGSVFDVVAATPEASEAVERFYIEPIRGQVFDRREFMMAAEVALAVIRPDDAQSARQSVLRTMVNSLSTKTPWAKHRIGDLLIRLDATERGLTISFDAGTN
jgi:hypothetical protein